MSPCSTVLSMVIGEASDVSSVFVKSSTARWANASSEDSLCGGASAEEVHDHAEQDHAEGGCCRPTSSTSASPTPTLASHDFANE